MHPRARVASFRYALKGIVWLLRHEPNMRIHAAATVLVVIAGLLRGLHTTQWLWLVAAMAAVWVTEALNTAIELLCDLWCEGRHHPVVGIVKDVAAGAVLLSALAATIVGFIIFFIN